MKKLLFIGLATLFSFAALFGLTGLTGDVSPPGEGFSVVDEKTPVVAPVKAGQGDESFLKMHLFTVTDREWQIAPKVLEGTDHEPCQAENFITNDPQNNNQAESTEYGYSGEHIPAYCC